MFILQMERLTLLTGARRDKWSTIELFGCRGKKNRRARRAGEDGRERRKKDRSTREVDSHLQSRLDPRSPPLLLPWQPDRRLGGGGRNEFLSSDRCRRRISAALSFALMTSYSPSQIKGGIHPTLLVSPQNLRFLRRVKGSTGRRNQTGIA